MMYTRNFLFSASCFGRDHSELDIIDDGHAYSKMAKYVSLESWHLPFEENS